MSIRNPTSASHEYPCERDGCTETFEHGNDVEGSFCSKECYHRDEGESLLRNIETDHTTCGNCGTKCKEIEPPTQAQLIKINGYYSTKALEDGGGYQYKTWRADHDELPTVCGNCGNCTLSKPFPESQSIFLVEYSRGLLDALDRKREQERHDKDINRDVFFEYLETPHDIPLALGRAIE